MCKRPKISQHTLSDLKYWVKNLENGDVNEFKTENEVTTFLV